MCVTKQNVKFSLAKFFQDLSLIYPDQSVSFIDKQVKQNLFYSQRHNSNERRLENIEEEKCFVWTTNTKEKKTRIFFFISKDQRCVSQVISHLFYEPNLGIP